jgi:hypothetical protein
MARPTRRRNNHVVRVVRVELAEGATGQRFIQPRIAEATAVERGGHLLVDDDFFHPGVGPQHAGQQPDANRQVDKRQPGEPIEACAATSSAPFRPLWIIRRGSDFLTLEARER